ncbi:MAG: retroviral-like aspartic protease family protein [bacterium]
MKTYTLKRIGQLLFTTGAVQGKTAVADFTSLVDTGSTYTILPFEHLLTIGYEPLLAEKKVRIITASGLVYAPKFKLDWISCFGVQLNSFSVVAHTLPSNLSGFGILGMDFLRPARVQIDVFCGVISLNR